MSSICFISFRMNVNRKPTAKNANRAMHSKTLTLFHNADHNSFKVHLESNPVRQYTLDRCMLLGFENVQKENRTLSDVAPTLKLLLKSGAKWKDGTLLKHRTTPYHIICYSPGDHQELLDLMIASCQLLLIDSRDASRCTPLMYCVPNANINCMKSLIAKGADVDIENDGYNFSDHSSRSNAVGPIVDAMWELQPDSKHSSVIMTEIFDLLLDSGVDVNKFYGACRYTPILYAMYYGNVECTKKLFENGARLNNITQHSSEVWLSIATKGNVELLECILHYGRDKRFTDEEDRSVLRRAVINGNVDAIRFLLELGVTKSTYTPDVDTAIPFSRCGSSRLFICDDNEQQMLDPYLTAVQLHTPEVIQLLEEYGCQNGKYFKALRLAVISSNAEVLDYLLNKDQYPVNTVFIVRGIPWGVCHTLLTEACHISSAKVIKVLLDHGADATRFCGECCSDAIKIAIAHEHVEGVAHIIRSGVNVNHRSCGTHPNRMDGCALPFEVAVNQDNLYAAEMLLIYGCSRGVYSLKNRHKNQVEIDEELNTLLGKWDPLEDKVQPLKQRCRQAILEHLSPQAEKKIRNLPLPPCLITYLRIPELDNIVDACKKNDTDR